MRIAMIGQKGLPATHGGVERHVEELGARLVELGHEVTVYTRPNYTDPQLREHRGMRLVSLPTIGTKHLDAIVHSGLASMATWTEPFDIVHYHAIGPCLTSPLARIRGRRVVATVHGQDWRRGKWGGAASHILRLAETMALGVAHRTISVSERLRQAYAEQGHDVDYIPNGITVAHGDDRSILNELGLTSAGYLLFAGRLVPEKGAHYLVDAWMKLGKPLPLVVAGSASFSDGYVDRLRSEAGEDVIFPGYVYGERLATLFRNAGLFVLPSDLEGLPIVLLEALAYGVPILASDIAPNVEVLGENGEYFSAGDVASLASALEGCLARSPELQDRATVLRERALCEYDWDTVARSTAGLYESLLTRSVSAARS